MLFLHGFPEYSGAWDEVLPRLADDWFCVAPDQRGYGSSWRPAGPEHYAMRALVSDAAGLIDRLGGTASAVVGHDWGASVAYALAMRHPGKVQRLVCINGVHPLPFQKALAEGGRQTDASQYITWLRRPGSETALAADGFERLMRLFGEGMDLGWMTPQRQDAYRTAWRDAAGLGAMIDWYRASPLVVPRPGESVGPAGLPDWDPARMRIAMPHLLIWGLGDTAFVPELRHEVAAFCDGGFELEDVPGADHWVHHQAPGLVAGRIRRFMAS